MKKFIILLKNNRKEIFLSIMLVALFLSVFNHSIFNQTEIQSRDSLFHLTVLKSYAEKDIDITQKSMFWDKILRNYRPTSYIVALTLKSIFSITDYTNLNNYYNLLVVFLFLTIFYFLIRKIFNSYYYAAIGVILFLISYYPLKRFSILVPENLALVFSFLYLFVLISKNISLKLKTIFLTILLSVIVLTNILTAIFLLVTLLISSIFYYFKKQYSQTLTVVVSVVISGIIGFAYSYFIQHDLFWINYLKLPILLTIGLFIFTLILHLLDRYRPSMYSLITSYKFILPLLIIVVLCLLSLGNIFLSNEYWETDNLWHRLVITYNQYLGGNEGYSFGVNSLVVLIAVIGIFLLFYTKKFSDKYISLIIVCFFSFFIVLLGPYFGLDPNMNTPRAMLYLSLSIIIFAVLGIQQLTEIFNFKILGFILFAAVVITSSRYSTEISSSAVSVIAPDELVEYINTNIFLGEYIYTDIYTFGTIYLANDKLNFIAHTPNIENNEDPLKNPTKYSIKYVIVSPYFKISDTSLLKEKYRKVKSFDEYVIYLTKTTNDPK